MKHIICYEQVCPSVQKKKQNYFFLTCTALLHSFKGVHEFAVVPFATLAVSVAGQTVWNSLPDHLQDLAVDSEQFRQDLKTYLFAGNMKC